MKSWTTLILLLLAIHSTIARTLEIKLLNTPSISIGGQDLQVGDKFDEKDEIKWISDSQAMKVLSDDNKIHILSPKLMGNHTAKNFSDYIISIKSATVRNDAANFPVSIEDHHTVFDGIHILLDTIAFNTGWRLDTNSYFEASLNTAENKSFTLLPYKERQVIITRDLLNPCTISSSSVLLTVKYIDKVLNDTTLITDSLKIEIVPLELTFP